MELNFDSFAGVVSALGGVKMYFPEPVYDQETGLNIAVPGCVTLSGFQALALVRARHLQYKPPGVTTNDAAYWPQDPESDLSRIRRDHEFLRVLGAAVAAKGLGNPLTDRSLLAAVAPQLDVDTGFSVSKMLSLVLTFHAVNASAAPQLTLPVSVDESLHYYDGGYDYGNIELPAEPQDRQVIDQVLAIGPATDSMTGTPLPAAGDVTVSVLNGTGEGDQAETVGQGPAGAWASPSTGRDRRIPPTPTPRPSCTTPPATRARRRRRSGCSRTWTVRPSWLRGRRSTGRS